MFLVVWGHAIMHLSLRDYNQDEVWVFLNSFHMPLFMTMVGFFAAGSLKKNAGEFLKHKATQLLLPILSWGIIIYCAELIMRPAESLSAGAFFNVFKDELWFLKSAFLCYIFYYFSMAGIKRVTVSHTCIYALIISLLFSQVVPLYKVNVMYPCFAAGVVIRRYDSFIQRHWESVSIISAILFITLYITLHDIQFTSTTEVKNAIFRGDFSLIGDLPLFILRKLSIGMSATLALVALFMGLNNRMHQSGINKILSITGQYTLAIYILQTLILEKIMTAYLKFDYIPQAIFDFLLTPIVSLLLIGVCIYIAQLLERNIHLKYYLFGKKEKIC